MGQRTVRVGELIKREISGILHSRWRSESVCITINEVDISPDLKNARVYYSVLGDRENIARAGRFLLRVRRELRMMLGKKIVIKYTPELNFIFDASAERAMRILATMDELEEEEREADNAPSESTDTQSGSDDCDGSQHAKD